MANPSPMKVELEDFRPGYPRYARLLSTDAAFMNFRNFTRLRMRLLLLKQDEISVLENQLDAIDEAETRELLLGCRRRDDNDARRQKLEEITKCLAEYDAMLKQCCDVLARSTSDPRNIADLRNWVNCTRSIAREETSYLDHVNDLACLTRADESVIRRAEHLIEDIVFCLASTAHRLGWKSSSKSFSVVDSNIRILTAGSYLRQMSRVLTTWIATIVVLTPIVVLNYVLNPTIRLILIVVSGGLFLCCVSLVTNARTVELFAAGASYTAVLAVFTSSGQQQLMNTTS